MNLILTNGYPYPFPANPTEQEAQELALASMSYRLVIPGVVHFEQKHTTTVEFADDDAYQTAQAITGWALWSGLILEAHISTADGYDYPAIVVGSVAYCGHQLVEAKPAILPVTDPLELLRACVKAKNAYWDCINALEQKIAPNGEFSDRANDRLVDLVDDLAAGGNSELHVVTAEHLAEAVKLAAL